MRERRGGGMSVAVTTLIDVISSVASINSAIEKKKEVKWREEREREVSLRTRGRHDDSVSNGDIDDIGGDESAEDVGWKSDFGKSPAKMPEMGAGHERKE
jgi:hypothetical protein